MARNTQSKSKLPLSTESRPSDLHPLQVWFQGPGLTVQQARMTAGTRPLLANENRAEILAIRGPPARGVARPAGRPVGKRTRGLGVGAAGDPESRRGWKQNPERPHLRSIRCAEEPGGSRLPARHRRDLTSAQSRRPTRQAPSGGPTGGGAEGPSCSR